MYMLMTNPRPQEPAGREKRVDLVEAEQRRHRRKVQKTLQVLGRMRDDLRAEAKRSQGDDRRKLNEQSAAISKSRSAYLRENSL